MGARMINKLVNINNKELAVKEFNGQRVITFRDIDKVHERSDGTASRNFRENRAKFIENVDYFSLTYGQVRATNFVGRPNSQGLTLITESGYLMLVKSLTDDLAWRVQRELVNNYFRSKALTPDINNLSPQLQLLINMEIKQKQLEQAVTETKEQIQCIRNVVALNPNSWRQDSQNLIVKMARKLGGNEYIRDVRKESYDLLNVRMGVSLETRLTNKRRRMADEGVCKSRRDKLNHLDVIADDKKLIEGYVAIVKDMAIRHGVA